MASLWTAVFLLLVAEVAATILILIPLRPRVARQYLVKSLYKIRHVFVLIALIMITVAYYSYVDFTYKYNEQKIEGQTQAEMRSNIQFKATRAQRNFYLSAMIIVLSFLLWRLASFLSEYMRLQSSVERLQELSKTQSTVKPVTVSSSATTSIREEKKTK
ncbi:B-cell receptor-associated protein 31 [Acrasis kona]|uniref:Endoplasmic reticulum transmembrane protein n=1 Tax=Acrasis kona TaxID=1008807 RepID=A0AAW2ZA74_9EUKA